MTSETFLSILLGLAGISIVVTIHELGHFLAARFFKIEVSVFSIGLGPKLLGFVHKGTEYRLSLIPLGGYCRMRGEQDIQTALDANSPIIIPSEGSFYHASPIKRIVVALAGPLFNFVSAILVLGFLAMPVKTYFQGEPRIALIQDYPTLLNSSQDNPTITTTTSPAITAGLRSNDLITSVNGLPIKTFYELQQIIARSPGEEVLLTLRRDSETIDLRVVPSLNTKAGIGQLGILAWQEPIIREVLSPGASSEIEPGDRIVRVEGTSVQNSIEVQVAIAQSQGPISLEIQRNTQQGIINKTLTIYPEFEANIPYVRFLWAGIEITEGPYGFFEGLGKGFQTGIDMVGSILSTFRLFAMGLDPSSAVSGPVRTIGFIGDTSAQAFQSSLPEGLETFARILALISIALFFGNLLPIPALDGGQIVLNIAEIIKRKPITIRTIRIYNTVGFVIILFLFGLAFLGDFLSLL